MGFVFQGIDKEKTKTSTINKKEGEEGYKKKAKEGGWKGRILNSRCGVKEKKRERRGQERTHK